MSAAAPAPTEIPPASRFPRRLLLALALAVVGFVVVWQGLGLAGFGTDWHVNRALFSFLALLSTMALVVQPRVWLVVRLALIVVGFAGATHAWLEVRSSGAKSAMTLREAVQTRDWYRERLAVATAEEAEKSEGMRGIKPLFKQYPSLSGNLPAEYDRWAAAVADDIAGRYEKLPPDDFKGAEALVKPAKALTVAHPASADRLDAAQTVWRAKALTTRTGELFALPLGDWEAFNRTAFGRRALAEALPDARDTVLRAEADWVDSSVELMVAHKLAPNAAAPTRDFWNRAHWELLTLRSLDTDDERFKRARGRLFKAAHDGAKAEALTHFEAGRHDRAFGVARAHAVDWFVTANVLGEREARSLTDLKAAYEFFDALDAKSAKPPEVAPRPRLKP